MEQLNDITVGASTPTVKYSGAITVVIRDSRGKERIVCHHNEGGPGLYSVICRALAGLPIDNYLPKTLMAYYNGTSAALVQAVAYSTTPVTYQENGGSWVTGTETPSKIRYSFIIPSQLIIGTPTLNKFQLKNNLGQLCAEVELETGEEITVESGSNIILYWDMSFN